VIQLVQQLLLDVEVVGQHALAEMFSTGTVQPATTALAQCSQQQQHWHSATSSNSKGSSTAGRGSESNIGDSTQALQQQTQCWLRQHHFVLQQQEQ
jgi:hypothetical protein